jgi:hypothetical protein
MRSMGKLTLTLIVVGTAACGSDNNNPIDAHIVPPIDAKPIDAPKVFNDAPPVNYNFACFGLPAPTTATATVTVSGTVETIVGQTPTPVEGATVQAFKAGNATVLDTETSAADGTFTTAALTTNGVPLDGYLRASKAASRTTYLYPPNKLAANLVGAPLPLLSDTTFAALSGFLGAQDDVNDGVLLLAITDCSLAPITGATATAMQGATSIALTDLSMLQAGLYVALNVPDGDVTVGGSYSSMTFPTHVAHVYKKPGDANAEGTITSTAVVPGPF